MCRVPPVGESEATWCLSGKVVGSGQCVCTGGECLHQSGAGAVSRSNLRGSRPQYRHISTDPGASPDRETFQTESPGNRFQPTQNSLSAFAVQGHPCAGAPTWYREGRVVSPPCGSGARLNPEPSSRQLSQSRAAPVPGFHGS